MLEDIHQGANSFSFNKNKIGRSAIQKGGRRDTWIFDIFVSFHYYAYSTVRLRILRSTSSKTNLKLLDSIVVQGVTLNMRAPMHSMFTLCYGLGGCGQLGIVDSTFSTVANVP